MTTIAIKSLSFSTKIIESSLNFLKTFLARTMVGFMYARQIQANRQIAKDLIHEYSAAGYTEETLFHELCVKTSQDEMYKKWKK